MRRAAACLAGAMALLGGAAQAQVTGVVTHTSATVQFRPGAEPGDTGITVYNGQQLSEILGSNGFGSGGSFSSTSRVDEEVIEFQNGNVAGGSLSYLSSRTVVDIHFTNDGDSAVTPSLKSTITPAGMGIFTAGDCLVDITGCKAGTTFPGDFRDFQEFGPGNGDQIAGAAFTFRITGAGEVMYELKGNIALLYDGTSGDNILYTDMDDAAAALAGFRSVATPERELSYAWDATDIFVDFPTGTLLQPGESSSLTYETIVESYTYTQCYQQLTSACVIAYSSFGDPIGRGGTARPPLRMANALALPLGESDTLSFQTFNFAYPTFHEGQLSYEMIPPTSVVPEPETWLMMIIGFGILGVGARRRRTVSAVS